MNRFLIIKVIEKLKINKNILKFLIKIFIFLYSFFISLISINLFLLSNIKRGRKGYVFISLRITRKYFGHLLIEPAILSSLVSENNKLIPLVSYKSSKRINNQIIKRSLNKCFKFYPDYKLFLIEHLFNFSFPFLKKIFSGLYKPLLPKNLVTREITYVRNLETKKEFPWRKVMNLHIKKNEDQNLIIALRTKHFNENIKGVSPQPWRDVEKEDLFHLIEVINKLEIKNKKVKILSDEFLLNEIKEKYELNKNFLLLDQNKNDFLSIVNNNSIIINNGNGIGAAAFALGLKTLYIHHTLYHFWHTSHSNSLCFPSLFQNNTSENSIYKSIELAFSTRELIPFDFQKNFYSKNIRTNSIKDISNEVLSELLLEIINPIKESRFCETYLNCNFYYSNKHEKEFWKFFLDKLPTELKLIHNNISLKVSKTFLLKNLN